MKIKVWVFFLIVASCAALLGVISTYYLNLVERDIKQIEHFYLTQSNAAHEIKFNSTQAHVLLEEILAGDSAEDLDHVWSMLDKSEQYTKVLQAGNTTQLGSLHPVQDALIKNKVNLVFERIIEFRKFAKERIEFELFTSAAGSDPDEKYDELYEAIQIQLNVLIGLHMQAEHLKIIRNAGLSKYYIANGHLFLEELIAGDDSYQIDEIVGDFKQAKNLVMSVIDSESSSGIAANLDALIAISYQRYRNELAFSKKRAELDVKFDDSFDQFYRDIDMANEAIRAVINKELDSLRKSKKTSQMATLIITLLAFIFAFSFARVVTRELV